MRCYFTAIFTLSLPILTTTMVPFVVETGDVDETTGRLDGDATLFADSIPSATSIALIVPKSLQGSVVL